MRLPPAQGRWRAALTSRPAPWRWRQAMSRNLMLEPEGNVFGKLMRNQALGGGTAALSGIQ